MGKGSTFDASKDAVVTVVKPGVVEIRSYNGNRPRIVVKVGQYADGTPRFESVSEAAFDGIAETGAAAGDALGKACEAFDAAGGKVKAPAKVKAPSATATTLAQLAQGQAALADALAKLASVVGSK